MAEEKSSVMNDLSKCKGYIIGVITFATTVATFLINVWHFRPEPTITAVAGFAATMLFIGWLIKRSEERQVTAMTRHEKKTEAMIEGFKTDLSYLKAMAIENQRSTLRTEMNDLIARQPCNHDRILKCAEKYFMEFNGDWTQTDMFLEWVEGEANKGRKVHIPPQLLANVNNKVAKESEYQING